MINGNESSTIYCIINFLKFVIWLTPRTVLLSTTFENIVYRGLYLTIKIINSSKLGLTTVVLRND